MAGEREGADEVGEGEGDEGEEGGEGEEEGGVVEASSLRAEESAHGRGIVTQSRHQRGRIRRLRQRLFAKTPGPPSAIGGEPRLGFFILAGGEGARDTMARSRVYSV